MIPFWTKSFKFSLLWWYQPECQVSTCMPGINLSARYQPVCQNRDFFGAHFPSKLSKNHTPVSKKRDPGTQRTQSASVSRGQCRSMSATGASQRGVRTASRNHPSSRAGDQDDVSYKQTPSNQSWWIKVNYWRSRTNDDLWWINAELKRTNDELTPPTWGARARHPHSIKYSHFLPCQNQNSTSFLLDSQHSQLSSK